MGVTRLGEVIREGAELLRATLPQVRMIFTSGFSESVTHHSFLDFGFSGYLEKPFVTEDLAVAIRDVMEGGGR